MSAFDNATLMITGGTGSFGSTVLKHFLDSDLKEIRIFSRDEKKQDDMRHELQAKHPENAKKEYGCGAKVFNRLLHLHGIQYLANGQWVLYSEHHGKGYTSSLTFRLQRSDGSEVEKLHTA